METFTVSLKRLLCLDCIYKVHQSKNLRRSVVSLPVVAHVRYEYSYNIDSPFF